MSLAHVSVIIIFLNEERFLAEAVGSVLAQTYTDWELILVDDGSADRSAEIARGFAGRDPSRVRYACHPGHANRGMSASRNLGLRLAAGDYVAFLDADDLWLPDKLAEQTAILQREPDAGLVYGRTLIWRSWDNPFGERDFFYELGVEPDRLYPPPVLFKVLVENRAQTPTTCNALMRRSLVAEVGGFVEAFRGMFEDQVFFAKALLRAPAYVDDRCWAKYRQHKANSTNVAARAGVEERGRIRFLIWLGRYLREQHRGDAALRSDVRRRLGRAVVDVGRGRLKRVLRRIRAL